MYVQYEHFSSIEYKKKKNWKATAPSRGVFISTGDVRASAPFQRCVQVVRDEP